MESELDNILRNADKIREQLSKEIIVDAKKLGHSLTTEDVATWTRVDHIFREMERAEDAKIRDRISRLVPGTNSRH